VSTTPVINHTQILLKVKDIGDKLITGGKFISVVLDTGDKTPETT